MNNAIMKASRYSLPPLHIRLDRVLCLDLAPAEKVLLAYLACLRANQETGFTFVSVQRAAADCSLSRRTVQRGLRWLTTRGLVKCRKRRGTSHLFSFGAELLIPWDAPAKSGRPGESAGATESRNARANFTQALGQHDAQSSPLNQKRNQITSSRPEDVILSLWKEISKTAPGITQRSWQWAAARILARAKTPPRDPVAFLRRSWPRFLAAWDAEVVEWLEEEAVALLPRESLADAADHLKTRAAEHDLPYNPESIDLAIDRAFRRLEKQRRLRSELEIGRMRSGSVRKHDHCGQ